MYDVTQNVNKLSEKWSQVFNNWNWFDVLNYSSLVVSLCTLLDVYLYSVTVVKRYFVAIVWKVSSGWHENCINYSNTAKNNILFIDVSAWRRNPSSGAGRQYLKAGRLIKEAIYGSGRPTTWIETRGAISWATYGTSFYILTTGTGSQSWWRLPTWLRENVDKQYVLFGCIRVINTDILLANDVCSWYQEWPRELLARGSKIQGGLGGGGTPHPPNTLTKSLHLHDYHHCHRSTLAGV